MIKKLLEKINRVTKEKEIKTKRGIIFFLLTHFIKHYFLCEIAKIVPNNLVPFIHKLRGVHIGKGVFIDRNAYIDNLYPEMIYIEDFAYITANCIIISHISPSQNMKEKYIPFKKDKIIIKNNAFVGVGSIILPGVTIGEYALVGAGSVVTKDIPPKIMAFGNPAKVIKKLKLIKKEK